MQEGATLREEPTLKMEQKKGISHAYENRDPSSNQGEVSSSVRARMTTDQIHCKCCNAILERLARPKTQKGDLGKR